MVLPAIKHQILSDLDQLSPEQQKRAADLVHVLVSSLPKGASGRDLLRFAGVLDDESAREMREAIEDMDVWEQEMEALAANISPEDHLRVEAALAEADREAKEFVRRQMGLA